MWNCKKCGDTIVFLETEKRTKFFYVNNKFEKIIKIKDVEYNQDSYECLRCNEAVFEKEEIEEIAEWED